MPSYPALEVVTGVPNVVSLAMSTLDFVDNARHPTLLFINTLAIALIGGNTIARPWSGLLRRQPFIEL